MSQLKFYEQNHIYTLDDEIIPSVSEISRFASREIYNNDISKYNLDRACERGTNVHKATEQLDKTGKCDINDDYINYIKAYIQFRQDYNIKDYLYIEKSFASTRLRFAGTLDRAYVIDDDFIKLVKKQCKFDISSRKGMLAIIDFKTSSQIKKVLAKIQLPAYSFLVEENNTDYKVGFLAILHLKNNGKYKLIPFEDNPDLLYACLTLNAEFIKSKKRGNIK